MFEVTIHDNKNTVMEQSFLCANQIVVCVKFLEKTVNREAELGCLITARQCFFERILWCLARLKSTVKSANDHVLTGISEPDNFLTLLDRTLDVLSGFGLDGDVSNRAELRAELMMESREIKGTVEKLLSHSLAFANVALESDKNPITVLSQNVLKQAMDFEEEFSLAQPGKKLNESDQRMKAIELESSLCSLESFVNNALLRLVFEVFHRSDRSIIEELEAVADDSAALEQKIEKFDLYIDRLIQIGHFAIWFCRDDASVSSAIRSCLASIESIDSYLIPAVTGKTDPSIELLKSHFEGEINLLQIHVQRIIDTTAFCAILMEQFNETIEVNRRQFNKSSLVDLLERADVLLQHFNINAKNLQLSTDKVAKFYFSDFKLMLSECDAILNFPEPIDEAERRILKRFNILNNTIRKLQNAIKNNQKSSFDDEKSPSNENVPNDFPSKCSEYFNSIRASALGSILYESKRSIKNPRASANASKASTVRSSKKKRHSLRITIFKKHHELEMEDAWLQDEKLHETMDLQITEILDKLTDLSTTLA